ncbi:MAG: hypothetical protein NT088_04600 [Candidatus Omnitrophica bacterium]|nr:hypothetical protein [Candidatus Omnitrophota bacterium]
MRKARLVLAVFLLATGLSLVCGCETSKGVAAGVGATAVGAGKDTKTAWDWLNKGDDWFKRNLW